jgi:hypothetical protein
LTLASQEHGVSPGREVTPQSEARTQIVAPPTANLDADHDDAPLRFRHVIDILGKGLHQDRQQGTSMRN